MRRTRRAIAARATPSHRLGTGEREPRACAVDLEVRVASEGRSVLEGFEAGRTDAALRGFDGPRE